MRRPRVLREEALQFFNDGDERTFEEIYQNDMHLFDDNPPVAGERPTKGAFRAASRPRRNSLRRGGFSRR